MTAPGGVGAARGDGPTPQDAAARTFNVGDVVRYTSERPNSWCREGMAIMAPWGHGVELIDTYWGNVGQDSHVLTSTEAATAELIFNVDDYDELDRYSRASADQWAKYAPADREVITSQHRLESRWFIRKGAVEDLGTQIENGRAEVAKRERDVESASRWLEWARRDLADLIAARPVLVAADVPTPSAATQNDEAQR